MKKSDDQRKKNKANQILGRIKNFYTQMILFAILFDHI